MWWEEGVLEGFFLFHIPHFPELPPASPTQLKGMDGSSPWKPSRAKPKPLCFPSMLCLGLSAAAAQAGWTLLMGPQILGTQSADGKSEEKSENWEKKSKTVKTSRREKTNSQETQRGDEVKEAFFHLTERRTNSKFSGNHRYEKQQGYGARSDRGLTRQDLSPQTTSGKGESLKKASVILPPPNTQSTVEKWVKTSFWHSSNNPPQNNNNEKKKMMASQLETLSKTEWGTWLKTRWRPNSLNSSLA